MEIVLRPETVLKYLLWCILLLFVAHLAGMILWHGFGYDRVFGTTRLFRLDGERNIPTLFSTLQLFSSALCLAFVGTVTGRMRLQWYALAAVFLFLAADEFIGFHEMLALSRAKNDSTIVLQFAWLLPYLAGVIVVALVFLPFLLRLPARTRWLFLIAGGIFVVAALGFEALTGMAEQAGYPVSDLRQRAIATVEELMEMSAISLFIYAQLDYLRGSGAQIRVRLDEAIEQRA